MDISTLSLGIFLGSISLYVLLLVYLLVFDFNKSNNLVPHKLLWGIGLLLGPNIVFSLASALFSDESIFLISPFFLSVPVVLYVLQRKRYTQVPTPPSRQPIPLLRSPLFSRQQIPSSYSIVPETTTSNLETAASKLKKINTRFGLSLIAWALLIVPLIMWTDSFGMEQLKIEAFAEYSYGYFFSSYMFYPLFVIVSVAASFLLFRFDQASLALRTAYLPFVCIFIMMVPLITSILLNNHVPVPLPSVIEERFEKLYSEEIQRNNEFLASSSHPSSNREEVYAIWECFDGFKGGITGPYPCDMLRDSVRAQQVWGELEAQAKSFCSQRCAGRQLDSCINRLEWSPNCY